MLGTIPTKYKNLEFQATGACEVVNALFNQDLYFHQALIFYYGISKIYNEIAIITPTRFGKSFTLSLIALYQAKIKNKKVTIASSDMDKASIIFKEVTKNLVKADPIFREGLVGDSKVENLTAQISKKGLSWTSGGSISCISLSESRKNDDVKGGGGIGFGADVLLIDESALISDENYSVALRMMLESSEFKLVEISNPHRKNHFYKTMHNETTTKVWIDCYDAIEQGRITIEQVDRLKEGMTSREFNSYVLCQFQESGKQAFTLRPSNLIKLLSTEKTVTMGVDVARFNDYTVVTGFDVNGKMTFYDRFPKLPFPVQKPRIINIWSSLGCPQVYIDRTGLGISIFEDLQLSIPRIIGVNLTNSEKVDLIQNLQRLVESDKVQVLDEENIKTEFTNFECEETKGGAVTYNGAPGCHDDIVISVALACLAFKISNVRYSTFTTI